MQRERGGLAEDGCWKEGEERAGCLETKDKEEMKMELRWKLYFASSHIYS